MVRVACVWGHTVDHTEVTVVTSASRANLRALMIEVLLILSGLVPLLLALVGLGRYGLAKYRRWRNAREVPLVWFDRW